MVWSGDFWPAGSGNFLTDPDPSCNNGFIKLFLAWTKYKSESTNTSIKWWVIISNFIPTYLKYKNIFFFISISGRIRSRNRIRIRNFFSAEPDPDPWKKIPDPHPWFFQCSGVSKCILQWLSRNASLNHQISTRCFFEDSFPLYAKVSSWSSLIYRVTFSARRTCLFRRWRRSNRS